MWPIKLKLKLQACLPPLDISVRVSQPSSNHLRAPAYIAQPRLNLIIVFLLRRCESAVRTHSHSEFTQGLTIPSLTCQPTPCGKILGGIRLLDVGGAGPTASPIARFFFSNAAKTWLTSEVRTMG